MDYGSDLTTGTAALVFRGLTSSAMQIARYLAIFSAAKIFSVATIFGLTVSLVAPIAATDASCLAWILDLTGRRAPRRSCSAGWRQAPRRSRGISRFSRRQKLLALSPLLSPPRGARSPRAPLDARSSDFGISCIYEGHFKAEMRGFPTSHLRASSGAVECNRGRRQVDPQTTVQCLDRPNFL